LIFSGPAVSFRSSDLDLGEFNRQSSSAWRLGTEFMPTLDECSMVVNSKQLPGISLTESIAIGNEIERTIKSFPEVKSVVTKL
jgi:Cu/Ag efflux pump CusA